MSNSVPLSAATFLGARTEANATEFDAIKAVFDRIQLLPPVHSSSAFSVLEMYWEQYRKIGKILAGVPDLAGWRMASNSECEKLYKIDGLHYWAFAYLDSYIRTGILILELTWSNANGSRLRLPCSSLLDGARLLVTQIAFLRESEQV